MSDEKRQFTRVPFNVTAELSVGDDLYTAEQIYNLSIGGCFVPVEAPLESGAACRLTIRLSGTNSKLFVQAHGEIIRNEKEAVAVKFTEIEPDSLFHLQNIVRYNHPDSEKIEQEIERHPGLF